MKGKFVLITLLGIFALTGCSITIGTPATSQPNTQNTAKNQSAANNQTTTANTNQNASQNTVNNNSDIGQSKTVGDLTIQINSVRVVHGNDTSQPKNGQYIVIDAKVQNNGEDTKALYGDDVTLTDANGQKYEATYNPDGITELNYTTTTIPGQSEVPRGVFVFDASTAAPYTLTINQEGSTPATWTIQP